jgi:hypothetical protein
MLPDCVAVMDPDWLLTRPDVLCHAYRLPEVDDDTGELQEYETVDP